jgi:hypothetical protein
MDVERRDYFTEVRDCILNTIHLTVFRIYDGDRHQYQIYVHFEGLGMRLQGGIDWLTTFGLRMLNPRGHVHVLPGTLRPGRGQEPKDCDQCGYRGARNGGAISHFRFCPASG